MGNNYKIIADPDKLREFIAWLPECSPDEQYYATLFSRKKYAPDNPACRYDKTQLKRFTSTKDRLFNKIWQLESPVGSYVGHDNLPIPQESLAMYISPNPRDLKKSTIKAIKSFAESIEKNNCSNPRAEVMTVIQTTKSNTRYHVFDLDSKDESILDKAKQIVSNICDVIDTRGGYHILVPDSFTQIKYPPINKKWYIDLKDICDVTGDALIPVIGCYQGGYVPS